MYTVYFEHLPDGAAPLYESDGKKSYVIIDAGTSILAHDHAKSGNRVMGELFQIHCEDDVTLILIKFIEYFESLASAGNIKSIMVAHRGFNIIPNDDPKTRRHSLVYFIDCAIIAMDIELGDDNVPAFKEYLTTPISLSSNMQPEYIPIDFNNIDNRSSIGRTLEVAKIMLS